MTRDRMIIALREKGVMFVELQKTSVLVMVEFGFQVNQHLAYSTTTLKDGWILLESSLS